MEADALRTLNLKLIKEAAQNGIFLPHMFKGMPDMIRDAQEEDGTPLYDTKDGDKQTLRPKEAKSAQ